MSGPLCTAPPQPWSETFRSGSMGDSGVVIRKADGSSKADRAERVFTVGIFAYVVIRAIPIWRPLQDGNVNPWIFLALDLGTAYPYAKSWPRLIRAISAKKPEAVAVWASVLTGSVLLPYAYVAAVGDDVATWVWAVLALFLFAAVVSAALRLRRVIGASRV